MDKLAVVRQQYQARGIFVEPAYLDRQADCGPSSPETRTDEEER